MTITSTLPTSSFSAPAPNNGYAAVVQQAISNLYAGMSRYELAQMMNENFQRFEAPTHSGFITVEFLGAIAMGNGGSRFNEADQILALEFLKRDGFTSTLDLDRNGARDGKFDRQDIARYIDSMRPGNVNRDAGAHP